jgi:hypothetical protein
MSNEHDQGRMETGKGKGRGRGKGKGTGRMDN